MYFYSTLISVMPKEINDVLTCIILNYIMAKYFVFKNQNTVFR